MNCGTITLYIGPTKAGKSTELIRQLRRHLTKKQNICLIIPISYKKEELLLQKGINILMCEHLSNLVLNPEFNKADVIIIDDLHLFSDFMVLPIFADKLEKRIICASLDNDHNREPYNIINLIPKCEYVYKLTALCSILKDTTPGIFSIKNNEEFIPVSRKYLATNCGYLHIITGPMFSGKTTELIRICKQYKSIDKNILSINYCKDTRYGEKATICSHNREIFQTNLALSDLQDILTNENLITADIIVIDEVQFLKNAFQTIKCLVEEKGKIVIVSGLDGDYLQQPFGDVCKLIAFADKLTRLNAICKFTEEDASFSKRIVASKDTEFIGSEDAYIAVSRKIYNMEDSTFYQLIKQKTILQ